MSLATDVSIVEAFKLVAKERGVARVTIGNIADCYGCARQTVYYHFRGTMDLIKWITVNECSELAYDTLDRNRWKNELYRLLKVISNNKDLFKDIYQSRLWGELYEFMMLHIQKNVVDTFFITSTDYGSTKNRMNLSRMLTYSFLGQIVDWFKDDCKDSPEELMKDFDRLCGSALHKLIEDYLTLRPNSTAIAEF